MPTTRSGLLRVIPNSALVQAERDAAQAAAKQSAAQEQVLSSLASYVMPLWEDAKRAKNDIRPRLLAALRQRRGEYEPDKLAAIRKVGGSEIYMMVTSVKCRAAASWLSDTLTGQGTNKPWTVSATPDPELPDDALAQLMQGIGEEVGQLRAIGVGMPPELVRERIDAAQEQLKAALREKARVKAQDTERILEDELVEGGFLGALDAFVDDFVTYPVAILKGPVLHSAPTLTWVRESAQTAGLPAWKPVVEEKIVKRWYRVDPFKFYPAPWAADVEDGYCFEHHKITTTTLHDLIGAPGYNEEAIREVLADGLGSANWLGLNSESSADNLNQTDTSLWATDSPMDALEFYGAVPGHLLIEWGVDDPQVDDPDKPYNVNLWLIGRVVIKASINPDPLGKKPYRKACYETIPGAFYGNGIPDLIRDCQDVCNATARAMVNNLGIASGPQVAVNTSRIPPGEKVTQMYPWKIWQFESDPLGSAVPPVDFFQPQSNAQELLAIFNQFSNQADEYSGLPKYMSGDGRVGGAGRTASGLASLMGNANRLMKSVMRSIDWIVTDVLQSLHQYLMQYEFDRYPELEGDVRIVARGAASVMAREQLALRRSEFLAATANPLDSQILGMEGRKYLLTEQAKGLELDTDRIIGSTPPPPPQAQPGQPGAGDMPGRPGQPGAPVPGAVGSAPAQNPNMRPIGATTDQVPT